MYYPDLATFGNGDESTIAVGWLDVGKDYPHGEVPPELIDKLKQQPAASQTRGFHVCPFCHDAHSSNEIHIDGGGKTYRAPRMIIHYITDHNYRPPGEYLAALQAFGAPGQLQPDAGADAEAD